MFRPLLHMLVLLSHLHSSCGSPPRIMEVDVYFSVSSLKILVNGALVHEVSVKGGGMHVAALHEARGSLLASRTIPTSKPSEAYVLQRTLASFQPGRVLVLALMMLTALLPPQPDGVRYLAPAEPLLHHMGCQLLSSVGVGEMWAAIISRNVTQEAVVPRAPMALDVRSSYDVIMAPVGRSLVLGVSLVTHQATLCSWHRRPEMAQQRIFCDTYDGFPELCRCHRPLTPTGARATAPRLPWKESIPCVVAASKHPFHLYRVLLQLVQMPGGAQTPFFIRMEGECPATEALARLFNIPFSKYLTTLQDRSMGSVTQLIAVVTQSAVNDTFTRYPHADKVIFMEDDVLLSPDFLWYFQQTAQLMNEDPTILAVSAHNTYSFAGLGLDPARLLRGVTPPQWGWMATRRLIQDWVPGLWGDWDYWVMARARSEGLDIVFPELSRSLHAGSCGTHIDGFHQAMVFNRQSANLQNLTNLIDLNGLLRESYSATLRSDVITAIPLTLTSPEDCGPSLIPARQITPWFTLEPLFLGSFSSEAVLHAGAGKAGLLLGKKEGPFIMFFSDKREHYAVLWCLGMYTEDLRGDFEQVQQLRVAGKKLYLVDCPESPHCVNKPANYLAVPHDNQLMEALAALNLFRRSRDLRTPFRIRRHPKDFLEEVQLRNIITGYAVLGLDRPTFFLNKGMVMPLERVKEASGTADIDRSYAVGNKQSLVQDDEFSADVFKNRNGGVSGQYMGSQGTNTSKDGALHVSNSGKGEKPSSKNSNQGLQHILKNKKYMTKISADMMKNGNISKSRSLPHHLVESVEVLRKKVPGSDREQGSVPYTYYKTCVTSTCVVSDPLLDIQHLPHLLHVVANIAQTETRITCNSTLEFTVQDFYDNPKLFASFYRYP